MRLCKKFEFQLIDLQWERIFLKFEISTDCRKVPEFVLVKFDEKNIKEDNEISIGKMIGLKPEKCAEGNYSFVLNMSAADGRKFLENGQWQIGAVLEEGFCQIGISNELAYQLGTKAQIFPYGERQFSYNVFFSLHNDQDEKLQMVLNSYFMQVNEQWQKKKNLPEQMKFAKRLRNFLSSVAIAGIRICYKGLSLIYPKNGKRILFMSETKEQLWGNLKYIDQRMKERGLNEEYELNYSFRRAVDKRNSIGSWLKMLSRIAKSDYIFIDDYTPVLGHINLNKKTKLIQVWHAGEGFKSVGYSRFGKDGSPHPEKSAHKKYDYVTVGSKKLIPVYEEVFGIEKEAFLPTGMARLDDFLHADRMEQFKIEFYEQYPRLQNRKIILFAPTFRGTGQKEAYYDYDKLDLKQIYEFCGEEYAFLIKVHPFIKEKIQIPEEYSGRIWEFSQYPNINDLYYVTDVLITDYSSNYYEYALLKKPVLFFTYDREKYELIRGVHRNVKEHAPGKVCDTFEELMDALYHKDYEFEKIEKFVEENFGEYDGHASDHIIDQIILKKEEVSI